MNNSMDAMIHQSHEKVPRTRLENVAQVDFGLKYRYKPEAHMYKLYFVYLGFAVLFLSYMFDAQYLDNMWS